MIRKQTSKVRGTIMRRDINACEESVSFPIMDTRRGHFGPKISDEDDYFEGELQKLVRLQQENQAKWIIEEQDLLK
jgi:hypothetical protein